MVQDVLLHFMDASSDSSDDGFVAKASDFLAMEIAGTTTVKLSFRGGQDRDSVNTATLTVADLEEGLDAAAVADRKNPTFRNISGVVAGLLNADRDKYFVVADQEAGTYVAPFSGAVTVANAVD